MQWLFHIIKNDWLIVRSKGEEAYSHPSRPHWEYSRWWKTFGETITHYDIADIYSDKSTCWVITLLWGGHTSQIWRFRMSQVLDADCIQEWAPSWLVRWRASDEHELLAHGLPSSLRVHSLRDVTHRCKSWAWSATGIRILIFAV